MSSKERNQSEGNEEQRFIVAIEAELALIRARQKLAITIGAIVFLLLLTFAIMVFLFHKKHQQGIIQVSAGSKPSTSFFRTPEKVEQTPNILETPFPYQIPSSQYQVQQTHQVQQPYQIEQPSLPQTQQHVVPYGLIDYLERLKQIENQRKREASNHWLALQALLKVVQGISSAGEISEYSGYDPQKTLGAYDKYLKQFTSLRQEFQKLNPPIECQRLHQAYDQALLAYINAIWSLKQQIIAKDLTGVAFSGLSAQKRIDNALNIADSELAAVCQQYGITKTFKIGDER